VQRLLQANPDTTVIVSDDGLQHLALARCAELVVFDERGIGNGWCLPAGPLREPWPALPREAMLVLYNAAKPTTPWPGSMALRRLQGAVELSAWHQGDTARADALLALRSRRVLAVAGVAFPDRFFEMLRAAGLAITPCPLPDHHAYDALPWDADTSDVIVTEKDAVKLAGRPLGSTRVWVAPLDFELPPEMVDAIAQRIAAARRS
jgi:tetraacyldisaccharide 4'-kinase